jgi:flagellar basal body P-ring protein FlgI
MGNRLMMLFLSLTVIISLLFSSGCGKQKLSVIPKGPLDIQADSTIGSVAEVFSPGAVRVEGYGIVGSLRGTGSSECPPQIREYLRQYILKQSPDIKIDEFLSNNDTAVVTILGVIPAGAYKGQIFDLQVRSLAGTQTTSLNDGWLYAADLKIEGQFNTSFQILAQGTGPVYIDTIGDSIGDLKEGYILGGGRVLEEFHIGISLRNPDFRLAGLIRDRLNGRFGEDSVTAASPGQLTVKVPAEYRNEKLKFAALLRSTYIMQNPQVEQERIVLLAGQLASSPNKEASEIALEGIGRLSLSKLEPLLNSHDEEVQLRAARCMLNLGSEKGLEALRTIAMNLDSLYRIEALDAVFLSERGQDAASLSRLLLKDPDIEVKLAAYKNLVALGDVAVIREPVGRKLYLDQIAQSNEKVIYVTRSGAPSIVLFGSPIFCHENIFIQSSDGEITINASAGQSEVVVMRKVPKRPNLPPIQLKTSYQVSDIVRRLAEESIIKNKPAQPGLNISYGQIIALLKQMCEKGVITAEFKAGPHAKIGL